MGTHMWSSSQPSRRGRRMSLELPHPPIPLTAKDSEFLQRRPELFFPYLQTPFSSANTSTVSTYSVQYNMYMTGLSLWAKNDLKDGKISNQS